ncbi:MAG: hypothetical protein SFV15_21570 [Polyangiaceae bacterium]|nr:hypothetical protein [Polyangiaceae bacterium]
MNPYRLSILQERLLRDELEHLASVTDVRKLVQMAHASLLLAEGCRTDFARLLQAIGENAAQETELVRTYLARTPRKLGRSAKTPTLSALTEWATRAALNHELAAEAALALARTHITQKELAVFPWELAIELARKNGRWSRRTEALALLTKAARLNCASGANATLLELAITLAHPTEHRWVQPRALALLAELDEPLAIRMAQKRLASDLGPEDFLARERMVDFAGRRRSSSWADVVRTALKDPSDLVRMTALRFERDREALASVACSDPSHRVRAYAAIALARRLYCTSPAPLLHILVTDEHAFVAQTVAQELERLARHARLIAPHEAIAALLRCAEGGRHPTAVNNRLLEAAAAVHVLTTPILSHAHRQLAGIIRTVPLGTAVQLEPDLGTAPSLPELGQVLNILARDSYPLSLSNNGKGWRLFRGEQHTVALWRVLFELTHPSPNKRQGHRRLLGRKMRGSLRAPSTRLSELTATEVPGEPVFSRETGDSGPHLPLVDDLLALGIFDPKPVSIVSATGTTILTPPATLAKRIANFVTLTRNYEEFALLRLKALGARERMIKETYAQRIRSELEIELAFQPHALGISLTAPTPDHLRATRTPSSSAIQVTRSASARLTIGGVGMAFPTWIEDFSEYALSPHGNSLQHIAGFSAAILCAFLGRSLVQRRSIDATRRELPLVVGGWGTRGKSGTARLKAGFFHGMGYECFVKTTGCEAMFIHAIPGVPAREVFVYRAYDKASIGEQKHVLDLARRFDVRVFLWECMALQPDLVQLLQLQWMRDDYSTITNAYPDHEDVQGPTGRDVADVISQFVPENAHVLSAEDQMLPVIRQRALERGSSLVSVGDRQAELIADDLLRRFPYNEHPKNIALVAALARSLGVPESVAIAEMADNVVADLGVLKTYPAVQYLGRTVSFTNGMSANERTGALGNWERTGFSSAKPDQTPGRWLTTVVNNRADRLARSRVFARLIVQDVSAHRHILIGTNVSGLFAFIEEELELHIAQIDPTRTLSGDDAQRSEALRTRIQEAFQRLMVGEADAACVAREFQSWQAPPLEPSVLQSVLRPQLGESYSATRSAVNSAVASDYSATFREFVVSELSRRRTLAAVLEAATLWGKADPERLRLAFADAYRALFLEQVVPIHDPGVSGDFIIFQAASQAPPGARVEIMGLQNIKGTGLDLVYRWVSIEWVTAALQRLKAASADTLQAAFSQLMSYDDWGVLDAGIALSTVRELEGSHRDSSLPWAALIQKLEQIVESKSRALMPQGPTTLSDKLRDWVGFTFDFADSVRRERMARRLMNDLIAGTISHTEAAVGMRQVVARAKGNWMKKRSSSTHQ